MKIVEGNTLYHVVLGFQYTNQGQKCGGAAIAEELQYDGAKRRRKALITSLMKHLPLVMEVRKKTERNKGNKKDRGVVTSLM